MKELIIDGKTMNTKPNMLNRGAGMVSANNSSRLLLDYKSEHPEAYERLLEYIFGESGIRVTLLKIEMGSDVNSSSGTEPSVKRYADEKTDVTRGAGYQLAADAKRINPDLELDMLWWSEPRWYKETLDAAYETYGLKFDYVSAVRNERAYDAKWVKFLSAHLKSERDCPYDYSKIKIVGGDEEGSWNFAEEMLSDNELINAVDVIGSHYTSLSTPAAKKLSEHYGKELWFSEGCPPMTYVKGRHSSLIGMNGALDIANRIIGMYSNGKMTLYEYQPVVSAYYDGVCYCHKHLIGSGVIVSQLFGAGDMKKMRLAVVNSAMVTLVFGLAISILSVLSTSTILRLLNVPQTLMENAAVYMKIACSGTVAVAAYNWINAIMRAMGNSKIPLIFLGAASLINAVLDLLFVVVLNLGVWGAAFATVLAQGLSETACIIYCFGKGREIKLLAEDIRPDRAMMLRCIKTGLPIAVQNGLISVSMTALQRVTNGFGENVMSAYTVSMRIEQLVQQPFSSLNAAVSTFTGQNIGAGKK